ncbi:MAG: hypothetical protein HZB26_00665 [Candidatus Hydrogenedentes bacterium]|nr:hypothetical protein [Candidatus Hydrogenedentota bacterium]
MPSKKKLRNREKRQNRREKFRHFLSLCGLLDAFQGLPPHIQNYFCKVHRARLEIEVAGGDAGDTASVELKHALTEELQKAVVDRTDGKSGVNAKDVIELIIPIQSYVNWVNSDASRDQCADAEICFARAFDAWNKEELAEQAFVTVEKHVGTILACHSRIEGPLYWSSLDFRENPASPVIIVRIERLAPETERITIDGKVRPCVRCYDGFGRVEKPEPLEWPSSIFGIKDRTESLPVYIQEHALTRLCERFRIDQPIVADFVLGLAVRALLTPEVIRNPNGEYLVKVGADETIPGYFAASLVEEKVVLRTFLSPTMQGTPEAELLRQKLGLKREDIEYLHLDDPWTLLYGDLREDKDVASILKECGLGGFIELSQALKGSGPERNVANTLKNYIGKQRFVDVPAKRSFTAGGLTQKLLPAGFTLEQ